MNEQSKNQRQKHYLLTALGITPRVTAYALKGKTAQAEHAPLALLELLPTEKQPNSLLCLLTKKARESIWEDFARQAQRLGMYAEALDIPDADNSEEMADIIRNISEKISPNSRLTLDITHGPRHIPFVFYALALYLSSFRDVELAGAWYGKFESEHAAKPLINVRSLLNLPQWFYAVRLFQETGATRTLARQFEAIKNSLPRGRERGPSDTSAKVLEAFSDNYEAGFPMELGLAAGKLCHGLESRPLSKVPGLEVPLAKELGELVRDAANLLRLRPGDLRDGKSKGGWKQQYTLNRSELQRQAGLIERYLERGQFSLGIGLMREWIVSLGALHRGLADHWLERETRKKVERELGAMSQESLKPYLDSEQKAWGKFWDQLCDQRNQFAHHGMRGNAARVNVDAINKFWKEIKDTDRAWSSFGGGRGRLLVTPLGMSPGVLYSAVGRIRPDSVLVLSSEEATTGRDAALQRAGFSGTYETLAMRDVFNGSDEIEGLLQRGRGSCLNADEVLVNLTGGTTLMGVVIQKLCEQARDDQRPCRRFLLTDKRSSEEQQHNPWVESALFWLDKTADGGQDDD